VLTDAGHELVELPRRVATGGEGDSLTPRRREVLALIAEGLNNAAIARRLRISDKAVVVHTSGIYDALGIPVDGDEHRRVLAVVRYLGR
jgi:DNA-binding NarL/FixJ family response regulator